MQWYWSKASVLLPRKSCFRGRLPYLFSLFLIKKFFFFGCIACEILVPQSGIEPALLHWKLRILTTGPPGKSCSLSLIPNPGAASLQLKGLFHSVREGELRELGLVIFCPISLLSVGHPEGREELTFGQDPSSRGVCAHLFQRDKLSTFFLELSVLVWLLLAWLFKHFLSLPLIRETLKSVNSAEFLSVYLPVTGPAPPTPPASGSQC